MLITSVPAVTSTTGTTSDAIRCSVATSTRAPTVIPINPWATRNDHDGSASGVGEVSACAIPPSTAANSTGEGTCSTASSTESTRVTTRTSPAARAGVRRRSLIPASLGTAAPVGQDARREHSHL